MSDNKKNILPLDGFINHLKARGFVITVDHHLRMQRILDLLDKNGKPSELKHLLCPVFATSQKQQEQFYKEFDRYFDFLILPELKQKSKTEEKKRAQKTETQELKESKPVKPGKLLYILACILILILIGLFVNFQNRDRVIYDTQKPLINDNQQTQDQIPAGKILTITIPAKTSPEKPKPLPEPDFYQKYGAAIWWSLIFAPVVIFLLSEIYRYQRRRLVLLRQKQKKPPFIWPIQVETPDPGFLKNQQFYSAAQKLRQRLQSDVLMLDICKTIQSTIENSGFPCFSYKHETRPPEYLILINVPEFRDHYTQLFETICFALKEQGIFVERFFYNNDPQICFRQINGKREFLSDIQSKFSKHRLIIFGDAQSFLNPVTGELDEWTSIFCHSQDRGILTPKPAENWGMIEAELAKGFIVVPGTLDGLNSLVNHFENSGEFQLQIKTLRNLKQPFFDNKNVHKTIDELKNWLGTDTFQLLCACAVYPELHWNLTIYLAVLLGHKLTEENLLKLIGLSWFKKGNIDDTIRFALIRKLEQTRLFQIHKAIWDVLEKNPPPKQSHAFDSYQLNLAIHSSDVPGKKRKHLKELQKKAENLSNTQILRDYTLLRLLKSSQSSFLNIVIPKKLGKLFFKNGISFFGLRSGVGAGIALMISVFVFVLFSAFYVPYKPLSVSIDPTNKPVVMEFAYIPSGEFLMGSPETEKGKFSDESPNIKYF